MSNVSDKSCSFVLSNLFRKSCVCENVESYFTARQAKSDNKANAQCILNN